MQEIIDQVTQVVGPYLPRLGGALLILLGGWLVALIVAAVVRGLLRRTTWDNKIAAWVAGDEKTKAIDLEGWISKCVYYLVMLFVLMAFFQTLGLTIITEPLNGLLTTVFAFAPRLAAGAALVVVAWLLATIARLIIQKVLGATTLDEKIQTEAGLDSRTVPMSKTLGDAVYWFVLLLFLPGILGALALDGLLEPVHAMMNKLLGFLPNLLAAAVTFLAGWFVARILRRIVSNLLAAAGLDRLGEKIGVGRIFGDQGLSGVVGLVVYVLILVPVLIAALNALGLEAVTGPASNMLSTLLGAVPQLFGAALVLVVSYILGRLLSGIVANLLAGVGFNNLFVRLGLTTEGADTRQPSAVVGSLVLAGVMLFAIAEASNMLALDAVSDLVAEFMVFASHVILGLVIFGVGLYLAGLAADAVRATAGSHATLLAIAARVAILVLTGAMALRQMGLANEIINIAFGLILGAVAVSLAIAFGLGGREAAGRQLDRWVGKIDSSSG
ncbi:MAG: mechanosensitive ion channel [bacterium]|nr:mechanosensitive ion channel [bacterium]